MVLFPARMLEVRPERSFLMNGKIDPTTANSRPISTVDVSCFKSAQLNCWRSIILSHSKLVRFLVTFSRRPRCFALRAGALKRSAKKNERNMNQTDRFAAGA